MKSRRGQRENFRFVIGLVTPLLKPDFTNQYEPSSFSSYQIHPPRIYLFLGFVDPSCGTLYVQKWKHLRTLQILGPQLCLFVI